MNKAEILKEKRAIAEKEMVGKVFGRLKIISQAEDFTIIRTSPSCHGKKLERRKMWNCICDCGKSSIVRETALICGYTMSCGCLKSEMLKKRFSEKRKEKALQANR